jgi:hypothetical protein
MANEPDVFLKAHVSGSRTVRTYVYLYKTSNLLLKNAQASEEGQFFHLMGSIVFAAFTVEAFLNDVGEKKINDWLKKERRLSQQQRLEHVLKAVGLGLPHASLDDVRSAFRFRDGMAHGKTETLKLAHEVREVNWSKPHLMPIEAPWEQECTVDRCKTIVSACWKLIEEIHKAAGFSGRPFASLGGGSYTLSQVRA